VFGVQCNDRYWMPRPDQNFLSWGFGFLIISAIFAMVSGIALFWEGQRTYDALLHKEDEYTKAALALSTYPVAQASYPPVYAPQYGPSYAAEPNYGPAGFGPNYGPAGFGPNYGPSNGPSTGPSNSSHPSYEKDSAAYEKERLFEQEQAAHAAEARNGPNGKDAGAAQAFRSFDKRPDSDIEEDRNSGFPQYSSASNA